MKDLDPVPVELMMGCFLVGIIVSFVYIVDWTVF